MTFSEAVHADLERGEAFRRAMLEAGVLLVGWTAGRPGGAAFAQVTPAR